jgi:type IV secretory pathway VirJ component
VQAPPNTFRGAISLGFCPDLLVSKPLCRGEGLEWQRGPKGKGYVFLPAKTLEVPWVALQGTVDQVCDPNGTEEYVKKVRNGEIVILPKVGHGFSVPRNWMPQFRQAFARLAGEDKKTAAVSADTLSDLPLIEVPATGAQSRSMAVILTGDGGWGVTDRGIAEGLAAHGIPAVGWNSLQYYWHARTPEEAAQDLGRILAHYLPAWGKESVVLVGYSFGADVLPFILTRLSQEMRDRVKLVALLGLGSMVDFKFHLTDWLGTFSRSTSRAVKPEVEKLRGMKMYCFYGADDSDALCKDLDPGLVRSVVLEVGHRIGRHYQPVVDAILKEVP